MIFHKNLVDGKNLQIPSVLADQNKEVVPICEFRLMESSRCKLIAITLINYIILKTICMLYFSGLELIYLQHY